MRPVLVLILTFLLAIPAFAEVPLSGTFPAEAACPAYQSINRQTNPGNIALEPGATYDLLAANKTPPTHLRIDIPGASPSQRWVEIACGTDDAIVGSARETPDIAADYILAVNWQPAFCETVPRATECRNQQADSFEANNFSLHGLWRQPRGNEYCGVSDRDRWASMDGRWRDLPQLDLTLAQRRELDRVMPGTRSGLDRHEWTRHGTCFDGDQRDYIEASLDLMQALNGSDVASLFAQSIGQRLTLAEIRGAFDTAFGSGSGARVALDCAEDGNRTLVVELRIALSGPITSPEDFPALLAAAEPQDGGCRAGEIDAVGITR